MIWVVVAAVALFLVFAFALMRAATLADRMAERWAGQHGPYDHEARGDFDR